MEDRAARSRRQSLSRVGYVTAFVLFVLAVAIVSSETYDYDVTGRLLKVTYDDGSTITYTYDLNGNLTAVNASAVNHAPAASAEGLTLRVGETGQVQITVTDDNPDDTHSFTVSEQGRLGTATVNAAGVVTYSAGQVAGNDTVAITVTDDGALSTVVTIPITINPARQADSNADGITDEQALALGLDPFIANGDTDTDGIPDVNEIGDPENPTDTDGDGIIDALEPGSAATDPLSLQFLLPTPTAERLQLPELSGQVVSLSTTGATRIIATNNGTTGLPVISEDELPLADPDFDYPLGLYRFSLAVPTAGTATVRLQLPPSVTIPDNAVYRKVDAAGIYSTLQSAQFNRTDNMITLTLTDGGGGDEDGLANSVIIEPGGVGVSTDAAADDHDDGFCFIATAAYGSYQAPHVQMLRNFRDRFLLTHAPGQWLVAQYYTYSPPAAAWIAQRSGWRAAVRVLLLPLIGVAWLLTDVLTIGKLIAGLLLSGIACWLIACRQQNRRSLKMIARRRPNHN